MTIEATGRIGSFQIETNFCVVLIRKTD
jgi:hypothetical protein